jgi:hypothetical protein
MVEKIQTRRETFSDEILGEIQWVFVSRARWPAPKRCDPDTPPETNLQGDRKEGITWPR